MLLILLTFDILLLLGFALPIRYLYLKWGGWVDQKSPLLRPFTYAKRYARRSWVTRSFVIETPIDDVRRRLKELPEISMETLLFDPSKSRSISPLLAMAGNRTFDTGIELNWLGPDTVEIHARQYADWPANAEDDVNLPIKQRQRLVERVVFHLKSEGLESARVSYEMETPSWVYIMNIAIILLVITAAWGMLQFQLSEAFGRTAGKMLMMVIVNTSILWIPLAWVATRITAVFRFQSISLLDNVISTFGKMLPRE